MRYAVELSGEHPTLPEAEVRAVVPGGVVDRDGRLLVVDAPADAPLERLGLAHAVGRHLASAGTLDALVDAAAGWTGIETPFAVRASVDGDRWDVRTVERELGAALADTRRVDLDDPGTVVRVVAGERLHAHALAFQIDRAGMEARRPSRRPFDKPTSMHPRLARAVVNLARPEQRVWDPFCGTGGLLIEARLTGRAATGGDVDPEMVRGAARNLDHAGLRADLYVGDVRAPPIDGDVEAIATDPPYGRSTWTGGIDAEDLWSALFAAAADRLDAGDRAVVVLPKERADAGPLDIVEVHAVRVHRSLTRHVHVLQR